MKRHLEGVILLPEWQHSKFTESVCTMRKSVWQNEPTKNHCASKENKGLNNHLIEAVS